MGYTDIHSHILPGLDDGSQSMEQSLEMLRIAEEEGTSDIIATPHYKSGRYRADSNQVSKRVSQLQTAAKNEGLKIRIYPGTEIYYHSELEEKFDNKELHTLNDTSWVLVEFSPFENFGYIRNAADDLLSLGLQPVIAHVERFQCLLKDVKKVQELKNMGCGIQVNASSIVGEYGFMAKRFTRKLLKLGLIDYIGTDAHNTEGRKPSMKKCADIIYKKCDKEYAEAVLFGNAQKNLFNKQ